MEWILCPGDFRYATQPLSLKLKGTPGLDICLNSISPLSDPVNRSGQV